MTTIGTGVWVGAVTGGISGAAVTVGTGVGSAGSPIRSLQDAGSAASFALLTLGPFVISGMVSCGIVLGIVLSLLTRQDDNGRKKLLRDIVLAGFGIAVLVAQLLQAGERGGLFGALVGAAAAACTNAAFIVLYDRLSRTSIPTHVGGHPSVN